MGWFLADATAAFFGKEERWLRGGRQPPPVGDLAGRVGPSLGDHIPLTALPLPIPGSLMRCKDEKGESLVREGEFGSKSWRKDLGELKGSQGPPPPFPLGVPFTPAELYPAL